MECRCKECGKSFQVLYPSQKHDFCSKTCAQSFRWSEKPKKRVEVMCETCGNAFFVKSSDHRLKAGGSVRFCSRKCAADRLKTGEEKKCKYCGKTFYTTRNEFCSKECCRSFRKQNYKHKTYLENGYICEYHAGYNRKGNAKQHRIIMERHLGRRLTMNEVVHHLNGDKTDNRLENLIVLQRGEHSRMHRIQEKLSGKHLFGGYNNN